jgi:hypothetical protein
VITYAAVPSAVSQIAVYEWSETAPPRALQWQVTRAAEDIVVDGVTKRTVIVLFLRPDGSYLIDGPMSWPDRDERRVVREPWRRTERGRMPDDDSEGAAVEWLRADALQSAWPRCFRTEARWECWGIEPGNRGVLTSAGARLWWLAMQPAAVGVMRAAEWGRLVFVRDAVAAAENIRVVLAHPVAPPAQRLAAVRLDTGAVDGVAVVRLQRGVIWIAGGRPPPKAWMEIRAARAGPLFVSLEELSAAPASIPVHVRLPVARTLTGRIEGPGAVRAGGALVSLFRMIDPRTTDRRVQPRRVLAAETIAKEDGTFEIAGLGEADYELVAFHAQLGKASVDIAPEQTEATLQLASAGVVRGRVVHGGRPLAGIDVVSVPDAATFNAARDMTDAKGGDARTGADGRFQVAASAAGGGELRIGGGQYAVTRIPLPRPVAPITDVGDIDLAPALELTVVLDRDPGCLVQAIGPIGRVGLQMVAATRAPDGSQKISLPETGEWQFVLVCGNERRALVPSTMRIDGKEAGKQMRFHVPERPGAIY